MLYHPLNQTKKQNRLLHFLPGKQGDDIRRKFTVASLEDKTRYETISYVCGNAKNTVLINMQAK
ncbi:hypothetical protein K469DRAFT_567186 [Zopfia rhizophila CBS 207.26]|uniref:Uncharacterized protein n=1 Tax=Zopfia rhizophila CBS 207.26 TaxID=1314779 RepID=A0A6A6EC76_9PEZI|nr:hypothetical protein K469DRAFT_567186 [Zopfia rhizophila CBS 207.26]